jgi:hypothetical protein
MPQYADGDIVLYTVKYTFVGQVMLNTMHFRYQSNITGNDNTSQFNNELLAKYSGPGGFLKTLTTLLGTDVMVDQHSFQVVYPNRYVADVELYGGPGMTPTPTCPCNTAMVFTKRSLFATRWGTGSWHQVGVPEAARISAGKWDPPDVLVFRDALALIMLGPQKGPTAQGSLIPVVWGRGVPGRSSEIVKVDGQETIRVMRRRTVGVGK